MGKQLMILEVSQKQAFIFSSNKLKDNVRNSALIDYVTSPEYFDFVCGKENLFSEEKNLVYAGGGHTVLQFEGEEEAKKFAKCISKNMLETFPTVEMFMKIEPIDLELPPSENMSRVAKGLEAKKARRQAAFHQGTFGVEVLDTNSQRPIMCNERRWETTPRQKEIEISMMPERHRLVTEFGRLGNTKDVSSFIAVVHIDGNGMGKRVQELRQEADKVWEDDCKKTMGKEGAWMEYCRTMRAFSETIDRDFKEAYKEMIDEVESALENGELEDLSLKAGDFPVRRIITAGDDICFVTEGRIGIECARIYLEKLSKKKNAVDKQGYGACAGVMIVHQKYPFYKAYEISEELCSHAKRYIADLAPDEVVSAIDWHIDFGEIYGSITELRKNYETVDGNHLELRPYVVVAKQKIMRAAGEQCYAGFKKTWKALSNEQKYPRGKIKEARSALRKGEKAANIYFQSKLLENLYGDESTFVQTSEDRRCSKYYDAIELLDTYIPLKGCEGK